MKVIPVGGGLISAALQLYELTRAACAAAIPNSVAPRTPYPNNDLVGTIGHVICSAGAIHRTAESQASSGKFGVREIHEIAIR
jgi:hypothetical protein